MDQRGVVDDQALGQRREPVARRRRDPGPSPLHRPARLRVEVLDLGPARGRGVVVAADADRADAGESLDHRVGLGAVADDVAEMPDRVDRSRCGRGPRRAPRGCCGCPTGPRSAWTVSVAAGCSPRSPSLAPRDRAGRPRARGRRPSPRPARGRPAPGRSTGRISSRPPPSASRARRPGASSPARSPRFQATRTPPGRSSGTASSTRSGSAATARAVTHGQAPRWAGSRARASARTAATAIGAGRLPGRRPPARRPRPRSRGSGPSCRSTRRAAPAAPAGRSPAAARASRRPSRGRRTRRSPSDRRSGTAVRLSRTCATATSPGSRMAVRLIAAVQASSSRTWPSMAARCPAVEDEAEVAEAGLEGVVVRGREWWKALDARRERLTRGLQGTPPVSRADRPAPCHSRRHRFAPRA